MDPRSEEGERIGMSRYCDHIERRIAELEVMLRELVTTFNPEPKSDYEPLSLWDRAAKILAHD